MPPRFLSGALALLLAGLAVPAAVAQDQGSGRKSMTFQPVPRTASPALTATDPAAVPPVAPAEPAPVPATADKGPTRVQSGLLECRGESATAYGLGSTRTVSCEYRPASGQNQYYTGTLNRAGLDFGVSDQPSMLWMVLATSGRLGPGALAGEYVGFTSGAALGSGFSANVLVAKDANTGIALQPLSVSAENGLSISVAAASLTLQPSGPPKH